MAMPSPLDPYIAQLLAWATEQPHGFTQSTATTALTELGWQSAFADAVFTSARVRGLLGPHFGKGSRGRSLWQVSRRGQEWREDKEGMESNVKS
jgi:hypothetical protein